MSNVDELLGQQVCNNFEIYIHSIQVKVELCAIATTFNFTISVKYAGSIMIISTQEEMQLFAEIHFTLTTPSINNFLYRYKSWGLEYIRTQNDHSRCSLSSHEFQSHSSKITKLYLTFSWQFVQLQITVPVTVFNKHIKIISCS